MNVVIAILSAGAIVLVGWLVSIPINRWTDRRRARWLADQAAKKK